MNTRDFLFGIEPRKAIIKVGKQNIHVVEMSVGVRAKYETKLMKFQNGTMDDLEFRSEILFACIIDEDGKNVFTNGGDIALIKKMPSNVVSPIFDKILEISNLGEEEIKEGK